MLIARLYCAYDILLYSNRVEKVIISFSETGFARDKIEYEQGSTAVVVLYILLLNSIITAYREVREKNINNIVH